MQAVKLPPSFFLFRDLPEDAVSALREKYPGTLRTYSGGTIVSSPWVPVFGVGILLSGVLTVTLPRDEEDTSPMPLNRLSSGDSFGFLSVLTDDPVLPTTITAKGKCEILFFSKEELLGMMRDFPEVSIRIARFLAGRVAFLNRKLAPISGRCAEEKLAAYLSCRSEKQGKVFPFSPTEAARELNLGRASLYRALNALSEKGAIRFENKSIQILDPQKIKGVIQ